MSSASVQVLANAPLFLSITSFQSGVPYVVVEFKEREYDKHLAKHVPPTTFPPWTTVWNLPPLKLWHVAVICENKRILLALLELSRAQIQVFDLEIANVIGYAATQTNNIEFLDWININFTETEHRAISKAQFNTLAELGDLRIIRWVHDHGYELPATMLEVATGKGNIPLVHFLHEHGTKGCVNLAIGYAGQLGHFDIVHFLHENRVAGAVCSHLFACVRLHGRLEDGCATYLLSFAALKGKLNIIKYAHEHDFPGFTPDIMSDAAVHGHLDIVRFLHENRTEGCTKVALRSRDASVVRYLHRHRPMRPSRTHRDLEEPRSAKVLGALKRLVRLDFEPKTTETYEYY